mgnify:CR=1 FL=1
MSEPSSEVDALSASLAEIVISSRHIPCDNSAIDYGAISSNLENCGPEKMYITTAIAYTNGFPHVGHAYEVILTNEFPLLHKLL